MAWIQIHQQLKDHRKVLAAADELDIEPAHMLGLLISFWLWAIDNAPDGSLAGISDRMIARAAQWDKDPEEFVAALTSASLLDVTEDGVLEIHDWSEYTGKLIEQRENEKNRSRARRAAAKSNDRRTTAGQSADVSNENSEVVEVVYMTTKPKNDLPTHVFIRSALSPSTVLCEQVNSVSVKRIGTLIRKLTKSELAAVDSALAISLGIDFMDPKPATKEAEHLLEEISKQPLRIVQQDPDVEKIKLETERDLYRNLYNELLSKTMKGASA